MKAIILILSFLGFPLQDAQLAALRTTVLTLRQNPEDHRETRGATAELTVAKHRFRDWIESRLTTLAESGDEAMFAQALSDAMQDADLFCTDFNIQCFPSSLGFLDVVHVSRENGFLIVTTAVGIWCGYDYSAYVYKWSGNRWQRIWENEQTVYTEKGYVPQIIHAVHISSAGNDGNRLVLTLGSRPGCASAFLPVYYRVWRMNSNDTQGPLRAEKPLLEGSELANLDLDPPIAGRVFPDDVLIQFKVGGTGYGEAHQAVRHFEVRNGRARQVDPIAPTARDFVEEWLSAEWNESGPRAESPALKRWHDRLHRTDGMGDFPDPAMRCSTDPNLWQIGTHLHESPKTYYLVRWRQPYTFTMAGVSDSPYPDCTLVDPKGDEQPALLR